MEQLHAKIETYISQSIAPGTLHSFNERDARNYDLPNSPKFVDGDAQFVVFSVRIRDTGPSAVNNSARRYVGVIKVLHYMLEKASDREYYAALGPIASFLEGQSSDGVHYRGISITGDYEVGKWLVRTSTIRFTTNIAR